MRAMILDRIVNMAGDSEPLRLVELPVPRPNDGETLIRVAACGVCHTELDEIEGRTPPPRFPVIPGHQVVGRVAEVGRQALALYDAGTLAQPELLALGPALDELRAKIAAQEAEIKWMQEWLVANGG